MKCSEIMTKEIKACHPESTIKEAVQLMKKLNCGVIPVVDKNNVLQGIVTDRDIVFYTVLNDKEPELTFLSEFMTKNVITCHADDNLDTVIHKMSKSQVRRIPIVDDNHKLLGLITLGDVAVKGHEEHETFEALEHISEPGMKRY
ncbi:MAG TPA: CBS domain-containing protein [Cyanobacteria bacterium UBA9971]|nr:CBS domain-containing protein [Cyanobacteria bacterium UBA9971]